jgi:hypothetical protein
MKFKDAPCRPQPRLDGTAGLRWKYIDGEFIRFAPLAVDLTNRYAPQLRAEWLYFRT